jgi:hypothetical protein
MLISRFFTYWREALVIVKPEAVISWHRKGFRLYWTWRSRRRLRGRPSIPMEVRDLIRKMSSANATWGAPRIHSGLLKLGIKVSRATGAKYMLNHRKPPAQTWRTFLNNHLKEIVAVDFFLVSTVSFRVLFVFLVLVHDRVVREIRMLRAMWQGLETESRRHLTRHEGGNPRHSQGESCGPPCQSSTRPGR